MQKASQQITELELNEIKALFRQDIVEDPEKGFDRDHQIRVSAQRLRHLQQSWPKDWARVFEALERGRLAGPEHRGVREFKLRISREIRWADESADYLQTVSYVSARVVRKLLDERKRRVIRGQLKSKSFGHEHSVPVDVILRIVVDPRNDDADLFEILNAFCHRALLHCEEISRLDNAFKFSLPLDVATRPYAAVGLRVLPFRLFGLARYHAAMPGFANDLIALNGRAQRCLTEFQSLMAKGHLGRQEPNLCFLPDCVIV